MDELDPADASTWPELLTVEEAAGVLRMTPKHVRTLLTTGAIVGRKVGGRWYVLKAPLLTPDTPPAASPTTEDDGTAEAGDTD